MDAPGDELGEVELAGDDGLAAGGLPGAAFAEGKLEPGGAGFAGVLEPFFFASVSLTSIETT
jgi:hypothetical protein